MNLAKLEAQLQNAKEFRDKLLVADADMYANVDKCENEIKLRPLF